MSSLYFFPLLVLVFLILSLFCDKGDKNTKYFFILIMIILYSWIFGITTEFGTDRPVYFSSYKKQDISRFEPLFKFITSFLYRNGFSGNFYFSVLSFLEIIFILFAIKNEKVNFKLSIFVFITQYIFFYSCFLRQSIMISIFLFSVYFFRKKRYLIWAFLIFIASCFHKSALILYLFMPILSFISSKKLNSKIIFLLFFIDLLFCKQIYYFVINDLFIPIANLILSKFIAIPSIDLYFMEINSGIVMKLKYVAYLLMIPFIFKICAANRKFKLYCTIMYFGIFFEQFIYLNMNLSRVFLTFSFTQIIVIPYVIKSINKKNILNVDTCCFILGLLILLGKFLLDIYKGPITTSLYLR